MAKGDRGKRERGGRSLIRAAQKQRGRRRLAATHSATGTESVVETAPYSETTVPAACDPRWRRLAGAVLVMAVLVLSAHAIRTAPRASSETRVVFVGDEVPRPLAAHWIRQFPSGRRLFRGVDADTLNAFRAFLGRRPSVRAVDAARVRAVEGGGRVVEVEVTLREPLLPARLDGGRNVWLSAGGHELHESLSGPEGQPVVFGARAGGEENLAELLEAWSLLRERFPPGFFTGVRCDHPLYGGNRRGIRFYARTGTVVDWGAAGADRYGLSVEEKVENLVRTVACQGDMRRVKRIDVRFPRPFAVIPTAGHRDG